LNRADPKWTSDWRMKKAELFAQDNKYGLIQLT